MWRLFVTFQIFEGEATLCNLWICLVLGGGAQSSASSLWMFDASECSSFVDFSILVDFFETLRAVKKWPHSMAAADK